MSQDDQNRNPQDQQREDESVDQPTRESRGTDSQPNQDPGPTDKNPNVEDTDEMDDMDEDRDDDQREDGKNRRNNIA